jgi:hypothetical protein
MTSEHDRSDELAVSNHPAGGRRDPQRSRGRHASNVRVPRLPVVPASRSLHRSVSPADRRDRKEEEEEEEEDKDAVVVKKERRERRTPPPPDDEDDDDWGAGDDEKEEEEKKQAPRGRRREEKEEKKHQHPHPPLVDPTDEVLNNIYFGGSGISLLRFVEQAQQMCGLPTSQFNFKQYWLYTLQLGQRTVFRPTEAEDPAEMRRFLEWFRQLGYHVVFCWQRINHYRGTLLPFTLWQLIDNAASRTRFQQLIQLSYSGAMADRGIKDPGRDNTKRTELKKQRILQWFEQQTVLPRDDMLDQQDRASRIPTADQLKKKIPTELLTPSPPYTEVERLAANKHLLMTWCAQACNANTSTEAYRALDEGKKSKRLKTLESYYTQMQAQDTIPMRDAKGQFHDFVFDVLPFDLSNTMPLMKREDELGQPEMPFLPAAFTSSPSPSSVAPLYRPADYYTASTAASPGVALAIERQIDDMDVSVQQAYRESVEYLRAKRGEHATTAEVERKLLMNGSLKDQVFFARYTSIIANIERGLLLRSRLSGVMGNALGREWKTLEAYFSTWATTT